MPTASHLHSPYGADLHWQLLPAFVTAMPPSLGCPRRPLPGRAVTSLLDHLHAASPSSPLSQDMPIPLTEFKGHFSPPLPLCQLTLQPLLSQLSSMPLLLPEAPSSPSPSLANLFGPLLTHPYIWALLCSALALAHWLPIHKVISAQAYQMWPPGTQPPSFPPFTNLSLYALPLSTCPISYFRSIFKNSLGIPSHQLTAHSLQA